MLKKSIFTLLVCLIAFNFIACGGDSNQQQEQNKEDSEQIELFSTFNFCDC